MAKKSSKPQPAPDPAPSDGAPAKKQPPITVKKPLPPDAVKRAIKFYQDNREIERNIWRSIYG